MFDVIRLRAPRHSSRWRTRGLVFASLAVFALCGASGSPAQERAAADVKALRSAVTDAWQARDYPKVVSACEHVVAALPDDVEAWYRLGYAHHALGDYAAALRAHEKAASLWEKDPRLGCNATYNAACAHALSGDTDAAIEWLRLAATRGYRNDHMLEWDPDLVSVRDDPRFRALISSLIETRPKVAVVVHEGVELLDFAGPAEVFAAARKDGGEPCFNVFLVAPRNGTLTSQRFVDITPRHTIQDCPRPDVVVIPGGDTERLLRDETFMSWVREVSETTDVMLSVCTGAMVLGRAGLLDGHKATTHHSALAGLRRDHPEVEVVDGVRYVDNGKVVTAAGVAAGIDAALHVVHRMMGVDVARQTARYMEYRWDPDPPAEQPPRDKADRDGTDRSGR